MKGLAIVLGLVGIWICAAAQVLEWRNRSAERELRVRAARTAVADALDLRRGFRSIDPTLQVAFGDDVGWTRSDASNFDHVIRMYELTSDLFHKRHELASADEVQRAYDSTEEGKRTMKYLSALSDASAQLRAGDAKGGVERLRQAGR